MARALKLPMAGAAPPSPLDDLSDLDDFDDAPASAPDAAARRECMVRLPRRRLKKAERRAAHACALEILASNMRRLQAFVGLNDVGARLFTFAALVHTDRMLDLMSDWIGELASASWHRRGCFMCSPLCCGFPKPTCARRCRRRARSRARV
ncbi:hypothetical protein [Caballeronia calidae]|uniref:hypothetical protein n=1 Tax=Caballeronia calidae TaxID=1777139 RepID=UPI0012FE20B0|nr:hypothetical protein [Caballeronia calidae]